MGALHDHLNASTAHARQAAIAAELEAENVDKDWVAESKPIEKPEQKFNSPLLAARAERARKTVQLPPPTLQTPVPVPEGAVSGNSKDERGSHLLAPFGSDPLTIPFAACSSASRVSRSA